MPDREKQIFVFRTWAPLGVLALALLAAGTSSELSWSLIAMNGAAVLMLCEGLYGMRVLLAEEALVVTRALALYRLGVPFDEISHAKVLGGIPRENGLMWAPGLHVRLYLKSGDDVRLSPSKLPWVTRAYAQRIEALADEVNRRAATEAVQRF